MIGKVYNCATGSLSRTSLSTGINEKSRSIGTEKGQKREDRKEKNEKRGETIRRVVARGGEPSPKRPVNTTDPWFDDGCIENGWKARGRKWWDGGCQAVI